MKRWVENGAELAWLIDPCKRNVHVYKADAQWVAGVVDSISGEGPVAGFVLDPAEVWSCYEV